jgi:hypothetical protein
MSSYQDVLDENQRLNMLLALEEMPSYQANESILHAVLDRYGHNVSRDKVRTNVTWLQEQGLVSVEMVGRTQVATLTARGIDVALGRSTQPGVKRPEPKG